MLFELLDYRDVVMGLSLRQWLGLLLAIPASAIAGIVLEHLFIAVGRLLASRTVTEWDDEIVRQLPGPARLAIGLLVFLGLIRVLNVVELTVGSVLQMVIRSGLIIAAVWLASRLLTVVARYLEVRLTRNVSSDLSRRGIQTQIAVPRTILRFLLITIGIALILWQFPVVQSLGAGVLGVAGLAAAAATLSAQRTLGNIFAGLQIAIAQPVKIGDSVVMEGEFGTIEEITISYVVLRTWDLRRLILPMNYFLEKPIQNWTKGSTKLLGTVLLYTDYAVSVDEVRAELDRIVAGSNLWNGEAKGLVVTNLTDRSVELRALVSADDAGKLWDLRCLVREHFVRWLQTRGQKLLPFERIAVQQADTNKEQQPGTLIDPGL